MNEIAITVLSTEHEQFTVDRRFMYLVHLLADDILTEPTDEMYTSEWGGWAEPN